MSLDVCTSDKDHFIIPMRCLATGKVHNVECVVDEGLFYGGYMPEYRLFFKDEWELVQAFGTERGNEWPQCPFVFVGGLLMLGIIIGCIISLLTNR